MAIFRLLISPLLFLHLYEMKKTKPSFQNLAFYYGMSEFDFETSQCVFPFYGCAWASWMGAHHVFRRVPAIRTTQTGSSEPDNCHFFAVWSVNIQELFCKRLIHLMKTQAQCGTGANDSTPAAEKERHLRSHQSGLWRGCHLCDLSAAARQRDCHKNRPQGEVRSLFTLISHSVGWNNNHSGSLYMPLHRRLKTAFKARWQTA